MSHMHLSYMCFFFRMFFFFFLLHTLHKITNNNACFAALLARWVLQTCRSSTLYTVFSGWVVTSGCFPSATVEVISMCVFFYALIQFSHPDVLFGAISVACTCIHILIYIFIYSERSHKADIHFYGEVVKKKCSPPTW